MLHAENLSMRYFRKTGQANHFHAVKDVSLALRPGEVALLTGRSGSGKTTLLHMLAGLLTPTEGRVRLDDTDLYALPDAALSRLRNAKLGVIPQGCSLRGYNVMYQPTNAVIANPLLTGILEPRIGVECALVKLQPDYGGIMDLVNFYGSMMALCAESAATNLINSKLAYVFTAKDKAAAESFKRLFDNIAAGQPAVVQDKALLDEDNKPAWSTFSQNLRENFISPEILDELRTWEYAFDQRIGFRTANTEKRERLITAEVNAQQDEVASMAELWLEELQKGLETARKLFGYTKQELNVEWREPGGDDDDREE